MKRFVTLFALVALLAALPALATAAPKPTSQVTIAAAPTVVTFGSSTVLSGKLTGPNTAGVEVKLQENPAPFADGKFVNVATTTTAADGSYGGPAAAGFTRKPALNTQYRAMASTAPKATSPVTTVNVRLRVTFGLSDTTPAMGQRVRFYGSVYPQHDGRLARIQRRRGDGTWATVARTTLLDVPGTERSRYSRRVRVNRDGTYRVRVGPADADHVTGTSRRRAIDAG